MEGTPGNSCRPRGRRVRTVAIVLAVALAAGLAGMALLLTPEARAQAAPRWAFEAGAAQGPEAGGRRAAWTPPRPFAPGVESLAQGPVGPRQRRGPAVGGRLAGPGQRGRLVPGQRGRLTVPGRRGRPALGGRGGGGRPGLVELGKRRGGNIAARALLMSERLQLTDEQVQGIRDAQDAQRRAAIERRAAQETSRLDLRELMSADEVDLPAVEAKLRELAERNIEARIEALRLDQSVRETLTADQFEELQEAGPRLGRGRGGRMRR